LSIAVRRHFAAIRWALPATPPACAFTLRTLVSVVLAFYLAYALELPSPGSAVTTVLIVAGASRGAVLSKGFWRVTGTVAGAAASVVVMALFAQSPLLFLLGVALWLGLCTALSSLLRYFRGYGAVLAGYTITMVAFGGVSDPSRIFELALARVAVVTIGVLSTTVVFLLTDPGPNRGKVEQLLGRVIARAAGLLRDVLSGGETEAARAARSALATDLMALDEAVEMTSVEDGSFGRYAPELRLAAAELFAALTGGFRAAALLQRLAQAGGAPARAAAATAELLDRIAQAQLSAAEVGRLQHEAADLRSHLDELADTTRDLLILSALDQGAILLGQIGAALASLDAVYGGRRRGAVRRLPVYANPVTAARNGLRAGLALLLGGLFWIASQWPAGGVMLEMLGILVGLLAQTDSASAASVAFLQGTALAAIAAFVCVFGLLPAVSGFPSEMLVILPFLAIGLLASTRPRHANRAIAFLIFFNTMVGATNPMQFDLAGFLNTASAWVLGAAFSVLTFRVLLPPNPVAEANVLAHSVRRAVRRLMRGRLPHWLAWEHLQHQKLVRLSRRLAGDKQLRDTLLSEAAAGTLVGRHVLALRTWLRDETLSSPVREAAERGLRELRLMTRAPGAAASAAALAARELAADAGASADTRRAAAGFGEIAELIEAHANFFARDSA
jgi:uncharacterized membrane protein YccC